MPRRITIQIEGSPQDKGNVRLGDFLQSVENIRVALRRTEKLVPGSRAYFRVVDLQHKSPATIVLEEVRVEPGAIGLTEALMTNLAGVRAAKSIEESPVVDQEVLEAYRDIGAALGKSVSSVRIKGARRSVTINETFSKRVRSILGEDDIRPGSVSGKLERINLHNDQSFFIYPTVGPGKVRCTFGQQLRSDVVSAVDRYVTVVGLVRSKSWERFPYGVEVKSIEVHPDPSELPSLRDLRGMAPLATGDISSEDFVDKVRRDQW